MTQGGGGWWRVLKKFVPKSSVRVCVSVGRWPHFHPSEQPLRIFFNMVRCATTTKETPSPVIFRQQLCRCTKSVGVVCACVRMSFRQTTDGIKSCPHHHPLHYSNVFPICGEISQRRCRNIIKNSITRCHPHS